MVQQENNNMDKHFYRASAKDFEKIPEIRLKWGRDFYRYCNVKAENEEEKENG